MGATYLKVITPCIISGGLLGLSFSPSPLLSQALPWIAFLPFLGAAPALTLKNTIIGSLFFGISCQLIALHWIAETSTWAWLACSLLLSSQFILWGAIIKLRKWESAPWKIASVWTILEILKQSLPPFGLNSLASAAFTPLFSPLIFLFGESGLTFLILLTAAAAANWKKVTPASRAITLLAIVPWFLPNKLASNNPKPQLALIALIPSGRNSQPSLLAKEEWMNSLLQETQIAADAAATPDLILWSEGTPFALATHEKFGQAVINSLLHFPVPLLLTGPKPSLTGTYNSSFLLTPQKERINLQEHKKTILIPGAEFVPNWWPFPPDYQTYQAGDTSQPLIAAFGKLGINICSEEISYLHNNRLRQKGAQLLIGSNNHIDLGHWGTIQTFRCARLRAVETQTHFLRCSNLGISSLFAPNGDILWESTAQVPSSHSVPLAHPPSLITCPSVYSSPWGLLSLCALFLLPFKNSSRRNTTNSL